MDIRSYGKEFEAYIKRAQSQYGIVMHRGARVANIEEDPETKKLTVNYTDKDGNGVCGEYDLVVIGTPVWASTFAPPIRTFLDDNGDRLRGKKIAAFACYAGGGGDKALEKLKKASGVDDFVAETLLIDPLDRPTEETIAAKEAFFAALEALVSAE